MSFIMRRKHAMKQPERRLKKLEESFNVNDKRFPLCILIEPTILGELSEETICTQIIIGGDGTEKPKRHYRVIKGKQVFIEDSEDEDT